MRRVRITTIAMEKRYYILSVCVCSLVSSMQSAWAVLYCHLWPGWLYHVLPHYLINLTIFGKKVLNIKRVFWFSLQLLSETYLILRRIHRDITNVIHVNSPLFLSHFNQTWILSRFKKIINIKFHDNQSNGSRAVPCGRTDRQTDTHDEANSRFAHFTNAPNKSECSTSKMSVYTRLNGDGNTDGYHSENSKSCTFTFKLPYFEIWAPG
jgi:hypothetical protein